jgi:hypothetical protein
MNKLGPPKAKRRLYGTALRKLRLHTTYHIAALQAKLFERPFWFFEQWRGRLADQLESEGLRL